MLRLTLVAISGFLYLASTLPAAAQTLSALKNHNIDQPIEWEAERSELLGREDVALFIGDVHVTQGTLELTSDRLHVFYSLVEGQTDPSVERLDVTGNVTIVSPSERATSQWAVYDIPKRVITLGGGVKLNRGETRLEGDRLEIDLVSGVTKLDGEAAGEDGPRVRGRFILPESGAGDKTGPDSPNQDDTNPDH